VNVDIADDTFFINDKNRSFTMSLFTQNAVFFRDSAMRPEIT
jgi:hypothetical protein